MCKKLPDYFFVLGQNVFNFISTQKFFFIFAAKMLLQTRNVNEVDR